MKWIAVAFLIFFSVPSFEDMQKIVRAGLKQPTLPLSVPYSCHKEKEKSDVNLAKGRFRLIPNHFLWDLHQLFSSHMQDVVGLSEHTEILDQRSMSVGVAALASIASMLLPLVIESRTQ